MTTTLLEVFDNINFCVIPYAPRSLKVLFYILFQTMVQNNLNILDLTEVTQYLILIFQWKDSPYFPKYRVTSKSWTGGRESFFAY